MNILISFMGAAKAKKVDLLHPSSLVQLSFVNTSQRNSIHLYPYSHSLCVSVRLDGEEVLQMY